MKKILLLLFLALACGGYYYWQSPRVPNTAIGAPPGAHLTTDPVQAPIVRPAIHQQGYTISTVASYELDGRVLGNQTYSQGQASDLAPFDLALGWGPMADLKTLSGLSFTQSNRKYSWHANRLPYSASNINRYSANNHIIPANDAVRNVISQLQPGELISLRGRLVNVTSPDGSHWNSALPQGVGPLFYVEGATPFTVDPLATTPGKLLASISVDHSAASATPTPRQNHIAYVTSSTNSVVYVAPVAYNAAPSASTRSLSEPAPTPRNSSVMLVSPSGASGSKVSPPSGASHHSAAAPTPRPAAPAPRPHSAAGTSS